MGRTVQQSCTSRWETTAGASEVECYYQNYFLEEVDELHPLEMPWAPSRRERWGRLAGGHGRRRRCNGSGDINAAMEILLMILL